MGQVFSGADTTSELAAVQGNDKLLAEIIKAITELGGSDAATSEPFASALSWKTSLSSEQLSCPQANTTKFTVESNELDSIGSPVFKFDTGAVSVSSFSWLKHMLDCAEAAEESSAEAELKIILSANTDPMVVILGSGFGGGCKHARLEHQRQHQWRRLRHAERIKHCH